MEKSKQVELPKAGDDIYVPGAFYVGHGVDDFSGGLCRIVKVEEKKMKESSSIVVEIAERPGYSCELDYLLENQAKWKRKYGKRRGRQNPDYNPASNADSGQPLDWLLEKCEEHNQKVEFYDTMVYIMSQEHQTQQKPYWHTEVCI